eukprot:CAMPEP_0179145666 /NCGR_PEP_ID=MMETSP0796-20121207/70297_1 /TAXON_ID=73915 /ORGANISM="Pyrodinium bahamense, Strain pbaha01" /LENGTH=409 /DNA_ID=CAMNT_0020846083 /DNA_START=12 /DNA_END=1241 /DNA_ORIENTATION=+
MARYPAMSPPSRKPRSAAAALRGACVAGLCLAGAIPSWTFAVQARRTAGNVAVQDLTGGVGRALPSRVAPALRGSRTPGVPVRAEAVVEAPAAAATTKKRLDIVLLIYFALWYLGNYYYNITNKVALNAAGGASGFPMTIATLQLGIGCIWALLLWGYPDCRKLPQITFEDYKKTLLVGFTSAGAHAASVFALSAGAVSFGQIVKAAEPAFAALVGTAVYGTKVSKAKWLCLIPVIGGVVFASLGELNFCWAALITAAMANVFAAFKANENKKLMTTDGLKERMGSVGNQFALTMINSFFFCSILMFALEGYKFGAFIELCKKNLIVDLNLVLSGLWFYAYNELATMTIKKTNAVTQSVANTAKRVIVIVGVAIILGESLDPLKLFGCTIGIGGVFLYSIIDNIVKPKK